MDIVKLLGKHKGLAAVSMVGGSTMLLWNYLWNGIIPAQHFPKLMSFAKYPHVTFHYAISRLDFIDIFFLPLCIQANEHLAVLESHISNRPHLGDSNRWSYIWGNSIFSTAKAYKVLIG
jgi:hypothetical protein